MTRDELIEELAIWIYWYEGGMSPDEYKENTGKRKPHWKIPDWYRSPKREEQEELEEHARDDYRVQAEKVVDRLQYLKIIDYKIVTGLDTKE